MNENEIRRLAHAINALRPDWPISSLTTFMSRTEIGKGSYRDAAVKLAWVAVDAKPDGTPASDTPKRVLEAGPWHRAALIESPDAGRPRPAKPSNACRSCGEDVSNCKPSCPLSTTRRYVPPPEVVVAGVLACRASLGLTIPDAAALKPKEEADE